MQMTERGEANPKKRCVYADSWFASFKTAMALRNELGVHFTGPIKTAYESFSIERMRATLATMTRGEHIVLECMDRNNLWAIGWHEHHFETYITTHGHTRPGKPAHKKRQDIDGVNYDKEVSCPHILAGRDGTCRQTQSVPIGLAPLSENMENQNVANQNSTGTVGINLG